MIKLWKNGAPFFDETKGQSEPGIEPYIVEGSRACVLVIPGGAYAFIATDHEGTCIAKKLNENNISAFVLSYRVAPYHHPVMQTDVNRALRLVRSLSPVYGYAPDKIAVMGFSAGGHLAGTAATRFDYGIAGADEFDALSCRPDLGILCYPVISIGGAVTHAGTTANLLGERCDDKNLADELSIEKSVRSDTPPCFIWHTAEDKAVPCENSLMLAAALSAKNIPFELHIFPEGPHGLGLAEECPHSAAWFPFAVRYIRHMFGL